MPENEEGHQDRQARPELDILSPRNRESEEDNSGREDPQVAAPNATEEELRRATTEYRAAVKQFGDDVKALVGKHMRIITNAARKAKIGGAHSNLILPEVHVQFLTPHGDETVYHTAAYNTEPLANVANLLREAGRCYASAQHTYYVGRVLERFHPSVLKVHSSLPTQPVVEHIQRLRQEKKESLAQGLITEAALRGEQLDLDQAVKEVSSKLAYHSNKQCKGCTTCRYAATHLNWPHCSVDGVVRLEVPFTEPSRLTQAELSKVLEAYGLREPVPAAQPDSEREQAGPEHLRPQEQQQPQPSSAPSINAAAAEALQRQRRMANRVQQQSLARQQRVISPVGVSAVVAMGAMEQVTAPLQPQRNEEQPRSSPKTKRRGRPRKDVAEARRQAPPSYHIESPELPPQTSARGRNIKRKQSQDIVYWAASPAKSPRNTNAVVGIAHSAGHEIGSLA